MSIYEKFKKEKILVGETELLYIYKVVYEDSEYEIILTKRIANKRSIIHCINEYIFWEQIPMFPRFAGKTYSKKQPIYRFEKKKKIATIFIINGMPGGIIGLDDGIFRCANNFNIEYLNVMSYRRFKRL